MVIGEGLYECDVCGMETDVPLFCLVPDDVTGPQVCGGCLSDA